MEASDEKVVKKGVSLYPKDWEYLQGKATRWGISVSATIRIIIRNEQACRIGAKETSDVRG